MCIQKRLIDLEPVLHDVKLRLRVWYSCTFLFAVLHPKRCKTIALHTFHFAFTRTPTCYLPFGARDFHIAPLGAIWRKFFSFSCFSHVSPDRPRCHGDPIVSHERLKSSLASGSPSSRPGNVSLESKYSDVGTPTAKGTRSRALHARLRESTHQGGSSQDCCSSQSKKHRLKPLRQFLEDVGCGK